MRLTVLTALTLIAFAANSLLTRAALENGHNGAGEFTLLRLISGAFVLVILLTFQKRASLGSGSWRGAAMLLLYAAAFSFAYLILDTGTGALVLFASVQLTMIGWAGIKTGLSKGEIAGSVLAFAGFVYLLLPALEISNIGLISLTGFCLMIFAGIGWGAYTIIGHDSHNPLADTAGNFWRAALLAMPLLLWIYPAPHLTPQGAALAISSGALTSALGYALWYSVLPKLSSSLAATLQLLVPPLAAFMGWGLLGETLTWRLLLALVIISSGIAIVIMTRQKRVA